MNAFITTETDVVTAATIIIIIVINLKFAL
jgi:hypothetical protein